MIHEMSRILGPAIMAVSVGSISNRGAMVRLRHFLGPATIPKHYRLWLEVDRGEEHRDPEQMPEFG